MHSGQDGINERDLAFYRERFPNVEYDDGRQLIRDKEQVFLNLMAELSGPRKKAEDYLLLPNLMVYMAALAKLGRLDDDQKRRLIVRYDEIIDEYNLTSSRDHRISTDPVTRERTAVFSRTMFFERTGALEKLLDSQANITDQNLQS